VQLLSRAPVPGPPGAASGHCARRVRSRDTLRIRTPILSDFTAALAPRW